MERLPAHRSVPVWGGGPTQTYFLGSGQEPGETSCVARIDFVALLTFLVVQVYEAQPLVSGLLSRADLSSKLLMLDQI